MKPKKQRLSTPLPRRIAEQFCADRAQGTVLPQTIAGLSRHYSVSYVTMWKAVHLAKEKGSLEIVRGRRLGPGSHSPPGPSPSVQKVVDFIERRILEGTYRTGSRLPKTLYFAVECGVSPATVCQAYGHLDRMRLMHKRGKIWIIGPKRPQRYRIPVYGVSISSDSPVVLLIMTSFKEWHRVYHSSFMVYHPFFREFANETERYGIQVVPVLAKRPAGAPDFRLRLRKNFTAGLQEAKELIARLGNRYYGALFVTQPYFIGIPETLSWAGSLLAYSRPVIFMDTRMPMQDGAGIAQTIRSGSRTAGRYFLRCCYDQRAAVRLAIQILHEHGHCRLGILVPHEQAFWIPNRMMHIQQAAAERRMTVVFEEDPTIMQTFPSPRMHIWKSLSDINESIDSIVRDSIEHTPKGKSRRGDLIETWKNALHRLLRVHRVSALIGLNDFLALEHYAWLTGAGISVPDDVSIVSFDNRPDTIINPLTTVDFGYDRLGYLAAHRIIGDLPVKPDRTGTLYGIPRLIDRGSLARAERQEMR